VDSCIRNGRWHEDEYFVLRVHKHTVQDIAKSHSEILTGGLQTVLLTPVRRA
jgi:hypothetical protein